jgi:hypothetical protein
MAEPAVIFVPPLACKLNFVALLIIRFYRLFLCEA